jgi:hypothetical protein
LPTCSEIIERIMAEAEATLNRLERSDQVKSSTARESGVGG